MRRKNSIKASVVDGKSQHPPEALDYQEAYNAFLRMCTLRNLSEQSKSYYKTTLTVLFRLLKNDSYARPVDVTKESLENAVIVKQKEVSDISVNMYLRAWRSFFHFLHEEGYIPSDPAKDMRLIKTEKRIIQTFTKQQIKKLFDQPNRSTFTGYRDYTLMLLLLDTGCRVQEVENIKTTDIHWKERVIKVMGKGRKERFVPFQRTLEQHLKEYIAIRGPLEHDYLFVNIDNQKLSKRSIQEKIREYGKDANIRDVRVSPHTFRHTFARYYILNGGDAFSLQKILGHTTIEMVQNYVNLFGVDIAAQHAKFSPLDRLQEEIQMR